MLSDQFEVSKSILVISVYLRLFFREPGLSVTLKRNKTPSGVLIFSKALEKRADILSWQTAASEVTDRPVCRCYYLPKEQNVRPPICLFAFFPFQCLLAVFVKGGTLWL